MFRILKKNRLKLHYKSSVRHYFLSKSFYYNLYNLPKLEQIKLLIKKDNHFKNFFLSSVFLLLIITKQTPLSLKKNEKNKRSFLKKKNFLGSQVNLLKNSMFFFIDNLISIVLPLNINLNFKQILLQKNIIKNWSLKNFFDFLELEEFFEEPKERSLIEKFLFFTCEFILNKNISNKFLYINQLFLNIMKLPLKLI